MSMNPQSQAINDFFKVPPINVATGKKKNLVVRARAGTGKTWNIIEGVNVAPEENILLCAFNRSIAKELSLRIKNPNAKAQTLHALGFSSLLRYWERIPVDTTGNRASELSEKVCGPRAPDVIKRLVTKLHTKGREIHPLAKEMGDLTEIAIAFECEPDDVWAYQGYDLKYVENAALKAMELAATVKPLKGIDYSDMIFLPVRNGWLYPQYDLVVVDEAQDMTMAQLLIAQGVCRKDGRMAVVGDDRQAIYGFRGADSDSLDRLKGELDAEELPLTRTYRCGKVIVDAARVLVPDFEAHEDNHDGEIQLLPSQKLVETAALGDFILSRLNAPLVAIVMALLRNQKRARIAGRDVGAGLKTVIRKLNKGVNSVPALIAKIKAWEERETTRMIAANRTEEQIDAIHDKAETLITIADGARNVAEIESRIEALFTDDGLGHAGVITCSSVHRAKGLEANRVFMLQDTFYRRGRSVEEENLEYVAITRAKQTLVRVIGETAA